MDEARSKGPLRCRSLTVSKVEGVIPKACLTVPLSVRTTSPKFVMESLSFCWAWNRLGRAKKIKVKGKNLMDRSLFGSGFGDGRYKDRYLAGHHGIKTYPGQTFHPEVGDTAWFPDRPHPGTKGGGSFVQYIIKKSKTMKHTFALLILVLVGCFSCQPKAEAPTEPENHTTMPTTQDPEYDPEAKLKELGIALSEPSSPVANYVNAVRVGNTLYLSGKGPLKDDGENITGKVGTDLNIEEGYQAARITGINQLSVLKAELGNLNRVKRIVKVLGMVNAAPEFTDQPKVINGYSDLMVEVFGQRGKHARSAVGMGSLPGNIAVEVEMIVEIQE